MIARKKDGNNKNKNEKENINLEVNNVNKENLYQRYSNKDGINKNVEKPVK
jgi:hypothetical protein